MESWIKDALACWRSSETKLNPPASDHEIEQVEKALDFKFPEDFKQLYGVADGFVEYDWQEHMFSFWSLSRMVEEYQELSDKNFVGFCDFLIMSNSLGFRKNLAGVYKIYRSAEPDNASFVSQTFMEAVHLINTSTGDIY